MSLGHVPDITQQTSLWEVMNVCVCPSVRPSVCLCTGCTSSCYLPAVTNQLARTTEGREGLFGSQCACVLSRRSHGLDDEVAEQTAPTVRNPRAVAAGEPQVSEPQVSDGATHK